MGGWQLCARLCAHPRISPQSHSVQTLQKSFGGPRTEECTHYTHEKRPHICTSKNLQSMSEFDGLWKQQHNPACTKSARVFIMLTLNTKSKKKKKKVDFRKQTDSLKINISNYHGICIYYIMYTLSENYTVKNQPNVNCYSLGTTDSNTYVLKALTSKVISKGQNSDKR